MFKKAIKNNKGAITLEACVIVTMFMIFMLFFLGLFSMFMVQQNIAHSVIQTTQSLAIEKHVVDELHIGSGDGLKELLTTVALNFFGDLNDSPYFSNISKWYDKEECEEVVRERFIGYISGGDETKADTYLTNMRIVDGLDGLDFSESKIEGDVLYVVVKYKLKYAFTIGNVGVVDAKQSFCAKLW